MKILPLWVKILAGLLVAAVAVVLFWSKPAPEKGTLSNKQIAAYEQQVQQLMADTAAQGERIRELRAASLRAAVESKVSAKKVNHTIIQHKAENEAYTRLPASARAAADVRTIQKAKPTPSKYSHLPIIED